VNKIVIWVFLYNDGNHTQWGVEIKLPFGNKNTKVLKPNFLWDRRARHRAIKYAYSLAALFNKEANQVEVEIEEQP